MLLAIISKRGNMLQFLIFIVHFKRHVFDGATYPYKPSRPIPLERISHGNKRLFYYRTALSMDICHMHMYYRHFLPDNLSQEAIRLTAGDGGPSTGCHTHSNA